MISRVWRLPITRLYRRLRLGSIGRRTISTIDRHWDGITAYCRPQNKAILGFVEGLNNKIRVINRHA